MITSMSGYRNNQIFTIDFNHLITRFPMVAFILLIIYPRSPELLPRINETKFHMYSRDYMCTKNLC